MLVGMEKVLITVDGSVLAARLDLATLRHAVQSAGDLIQVLPLLQPDPQAAKEKCFQVLVLCHRSVLILSDLILTTS